MVVTEYGVADLRGARDEAVIAAMLNVADARFHDELVGQARGAGKLPEAHRLPSYAADNRPDVLAARLAPFRKAGDLPAFPFGGEMTPVEQALAPALQTIKAAAASKADIAALAWRGVTAGRTNSLTREALERLGLSQPRGIEERLYARLVRGALAGD